MPRDKVTIRKRGGYFVPVSASTLKNDLVAFWEFGDLTDATGNGHTLTAQPPDSPSFGTGLVGNAVHAPSTSFVWLTTQSSAFNVAKPNTWSLSTWVKLDSLPGGFKSTGVCHRGDDTGTTNEQFRIVSTSATVGTANFRLDVPTIGTALILNNTAMDNTVWTHLVVTCDGSSIIRTYANGVAGETLDISSGSIVADDANKLLVWCEALSNTLEGWMDQTGWWNRVLNTGEIEQLYAGGAGLSYANM